jgi:hypothetical protein
MGIVKQPVLFVLSLLIAVVAVGFLIDRLIFVAHAHHTTGTVTSLYASNGSCSCGRRCHYACTRFSAAVKFPESQVDEPLIVTAGTARGTDRPVEFARYSPGDSVPVIYDPGNTRRAYRDSVTDVWGAPLMALFFHITTLFGSFTQPRHSSLFSR